MLGTVKTADEKGFETSLEPILWIGLGWGERERALASVICTHYWKFGSPFFLYIHKPSFLVSTYARMHTVGKQGLFLYCCACAQSLISYFDVI